MMDPSVSWTMYKRSCEQLLEEEYSWTYLDLYPLLDGIRVEVLIG